MVTFFESYERELEKYWIKPLSTSSAEDYRRYVFRVMRTGAGDINPDDELCQSRKQRAASAVGESSIAFELGHHTWIDFDYHRTNDDSEA